jgi:hypothetical protein
MMNLKVNSFLSNITLNQSKIVIPASIGLSYFLFYTGYNSKTKILDRKLLYDFVALKRGKDWTLVELNKILSLTGLTTLLVSYLPPCQPIRRSLMMTSMNMIWLHIMYSFNKFYQSSLLKLSKEKFIKKLSVALGGQANFALIAGYFGFIPQSIAMAASTLLGIGHFWTMEVDYKYNLKIRPYAFIPFPLAGLVFYYMFKDIMS